MYICVLVFHVFMYFVYISIWCCNFELGGLLLPKLYVDLFYTNFLLDYPPISRPIPFSKHPILPRLCAFYINLLKYTQFLNLGSFVSDENPSIALPNFARKHPKRQAHLCDLFNVRTPWILSGMEYSGKLLCG